MERKYTCMKFGCRYHSGTRRGVTCHYALITGRTKLGQMTPEQRRSEECPFYDKTSRRQIHDARRERRAEDPRRWELFQKGLSDGEIARALGVTPGAIRDWRIRKGLQANKPRGKTAFFDEKIRAAYMRGLSDRAAAETVGCHPATVGEWRRRNKLPPNRKGGEHENS